MQYGQSGKKINKQEYYCTRCKRKLPYKICPLHGMESVIMLDSANQPSSYGSANTNGSVNTSGGNNPKPLPSGTGFEQPAPQQPVAPPVQARPAAPPRPQPPARPAAPPRPQPPARQAAPPRPAPQATAPARPAAPPRPQQPIAPPARPAVQARPTAPPARPAVQARPAAPPRPQQPPQQQRPRAQQPTTSQAMPMQPPAPPRPAAPPKPQPPKPSKTKPPKAQTTDDGTLFFEMEDSANNMNFEFDDTPASSLENLIEQNLNTGKPTKSPLEESTKESTAMDMGFDNEPISFDPPAASDFGQDPASQGFEPVATDPGIHRPASSNGHHAPQPNGAAQRNGAISDASPSRANVKRPKKRRSQAKARRTGLPISAKLALITLIPTVLVAAAVYFSFDKISAMSDSVMSQLNGNSTKQTATNPPVVPALSEEETAQRNIAVSQNEDEPVLEETPNSSGNDLSDRNSIEDLMVSAHQSFDKQQFLKPSSDNAILYLSQVLELQDDHQPAIELKSQIIEYYNDKASSAIESSRYDLAIRNYESVLQITPDDAITQRLLGQAKTLRRSSQKLKNVKALQKTQDEVKRLQKEKYKLKTQVKAERRKLEQINQAGND